MRLAKIAILAFAAALALAACGTDDSVQGSNRDRGGGQVKMGLPF